MHAVTVHRKCICHLNRVQEPLFRLACGEGDLPIVWCQHHSNREQTPNFDDICINAYVGCRQRVFFPAHGPFRIHKCGELPMPSWGSGIESHGQDAWESRLRSLSIIKGSYARRQISTKHANLCFIHFHCLSISNIAMRKFPLLLCSIET